MRTAGIICEYNPFHLGHEKQLRILRERLGEDTAAVCLMSGNYVQRGAPAVFDKMTRARAAVEAGADLVLELPITGVLSSAEGFAKTGVEVLDRLGTVDTLCFGCEYGDGAALMETARTLLREDYAAALSAATETGISYPAARQRVLESLGGNGTVLESPNDILGVEYCKALLERGSKIEPLAILRAGDYHAEAPDADNPSASAVRSLLEAGEDWRNFVPQTLRSLYENAEVHTMQAGERAVLARLRGLSPEQWARTAHGGEGLWSKVMKAAWEAATVEEILTAAKSKRYPRTRLQRLLLCAYLGATEEDLKRPVSYVRVLAFDEKGAGVLRQAKKCGSISIINAGEQPEDWSYWELERRAARLYGLFAAGKIGTMTEEKQRIYHKEP